MTIQLVVTDLIRNTVNGVIEKECTPEKLRNELKKWKVRDETTASEAIQDVPCDIKNSTIPFKTVKKVFELLKEGGTDIYLNELLEGSDLYFEPVKEPKKSQELVSRLKKLQAQQNQLHYRSMVRNVDRELISKNSKEIAFDVRSTSRQLSSIVNFVLSVAGTFLFGFISSQYAFANIGLRVIFGILLATIVALAELFFMARTEI